jgi:hypothetical protein
MKRIMYCLGAALSAMLIAGCASAGKTAGTAASTAASVNAEKTANEQRVVDWKDRGIGELASPAWLLPAVRGDWDAFRSTWKVNPSMILKMGESQGATLNAAQTIAEVQYAAHIANQLKQTVLTKAAISLNTQGQFDTVNDAAVKTLVTLSGQERLTDFWQEIETTDENGAKKTTYNYYVVYDYEPNAWQQIVAKYLFDVVGQMPKSQTQKTMAGLFNEIDKATVNQQPLSNSQFKAQVQAQQQALAAPMTAEQQYQAYKSGDPVKVAAASTTSADKNYIAALAAIQAGK